MSGCHRHRARTIRPETSDVKKFHSARKVGVLRRLVFPSVASASGEDLPLYIVKRPEDRPRDSPSSRPGS
jgi:hypothetical protein